MDELLRGNTTNHNYRKAEMAVRRLSLSELRYSFRVEGDVVNQQGELLGDEVSEVIEAVLQAHTDLSNIDLKHLLNAAKIQEPEYPL